MNQDNDGPTGPSGEVPKRRRIAEDEDSDDDDNNMDTEQINDNQVGAPSSQQSTNNPPNNNDDNQEEEDTELTKRQRIEARANERRRQRLLQAEARDLLEASYPGDDYYVGKSLYVLLYVLGMMFFMGVFIVVLSVVRGVAMVGL